MEKQAPSPPPPHASGKKPNLAQRNEATDLKAKQELALALPLTAGDSSYWLAKRCGLMLIVHFLVT